MDFLLMVLLFAAIVCLLLPVCVLVSGTDLAFIVKKLLRTLDCFYVYKTFKVPEFNDSTKDSNQLYCRVADYLNSLASIQDSDFINLVAGKKPGEIVFNLDPNQTVEDIFLGAKLVWVNEERNASRSFVLRIRKADKTRILQPYLQHIKAVADEIDQRKRNLKLYTNVNVGGENPGIGRWRSVPFSHPSTFKTITMEADLKSKVKSDLKKFAKAKRYYHRRGRVWRRSYLLYGPSGTGKTSFIAAMANFLRYDVYDLDLSKVRDDSDLKMHLLQTTSRSVIVIEDLDRFFMEKSTAVSLSGLLNFMDGHLNSCCAEERIMVFTTNRKENIDTAILRPGRVDVQIHFPLCDFIAFKNLASSYLGLQEHRLFPQVEEIFQSGSSLSSAEISELMIANRKSRTRAIKSVITALQTDADGRRLPENGSRSWVHQAGRFLMRSIRSRISRRVADSVLPVQETR